MLKWYKEYFGLNSDDVEELYRESNIIALDLKLRFSNAVFTYQIHLYPFLKTLQKRDGEITVVETGMATGISTVLILKALEPGSKLYTLDPGGYAYPPYRNIVDMHFGLARAMDDIPTDKWAPIPKTSWDVLEGTLEDLGEIDVFLHDSDHERPCQDFEYATAWPYIKPTGFMLSDDYTWGDPPHLAWADFVKEQGLEFIKMGSCAVISKEQLS